MRVRSHGHARTITNATSARPLSRVRVAVSARARR